MTPGARAPASPEAIRALRPARWAEALFAALAFFYWIGLPAPRPATLALWIHWLGLALLAATLAWRLGRPDRTAWWVAALLAGYVLLSAPLSLGRVSRVLQGGALAEPAIVIAVALLALTWGTQGVVALALWRTRSLRRAAS